MAESTVTVKVELSDESKRLIAEMVKPLYVLTCDPPVPITPPTIRYTFLDEEPTPVRDEQRDELTIAIDTAIGEALGWPNGVYDATDAVLAVITPTTDRNEYMDAVIGQTIKFHNYAEEILRIAERCKTVAEFDEATDIFVGSIDGDEDNFWNAVLHLAYQERYGE